MQRPRVGAPSAGEGARILSVEPEPSREGRETKMGLEQQPWTGCADHGETCRFARRVMRSHGKLKWGSCMVLAMISKVHFECRVNV